MRNPPCFVLLALAATLLIGIGTAQAQVGPPPVAGAIAQGTVLENAFPIALQASAMSAEAALPVHPTAPAAPRGVLVPLYVSFAALQAMDVHSTLRVTNAGGFERNPFMKGIVERPAVFAGLKGGIAAGTILAAEKVRPHSRIGAIVMMAALNSVYASVVAHNYAQ